MCVWMRRYDVDSSGTLNTGEELTMLSLNLVTKLDLNLSMEAFDLLVAETAAEIDAEELEMTEAAFAEWFLAAVGPLATGLKHIPAMDNM